MRAYIFWFGYRGSCIVIAESLEEAKQLMLEEDKEYESILRGEIEEKELTKGILHHDLGDV